MGFTIATRNYPDEVKARLLDLNSVSVDENIDDEYTLFNINLECSDNTRLKKTLADIVAEIVLNKLESRLVSSIIENDYSQFNREERGRIKKFTRSYLNKRDKLVEKINIISQLLNYLDKYRAINIEGFVRFRLKDYVQHLKFAVDKAVDDFIVEKEYNEFIDLLKYFIELQEPRIAMVHVLKKDDGSFIILDPQYEPIQTDYLEGYIAELVDEEVKYEDLLISALINISPGEIILHFNDKDIELTVRDIFTDRVTVCTGCEFCQPVKT